MRIEKRQTGVDPARVLTEANARRVQREGVARTAALALKLARATFSTSTDPAGTPWRPLKRPRAGKILVRTGRLRRSLSVSVSPRTFVLHAGAPYAMYHQRGTSRVPRRSFLPYGAMPPAWVRAFDRVLGEVARETFGS